MGLILTLAAARIGAAGAAETCVAWGEPGDLTDADIEDVEESSGVAASTLEPGLYYTINDAGGEASLYMFDEAGEFRGEQLVNGATNTDWEDLAAGPCPAAVNADACLYIGDIGDNDSDHESITIWVVPESLGTIVDAVACPLVWPDARPRDAETLLVAPAGSESPGSVRVVSKEEGGTARVMKVDSLTCGSEPQVLTEEAEITLDSPATGGVMTADTVVIRTLSTAWIWPDCGFRPSTWQGAPESLTLGVDPQGEGIAVTSDGGLITTSETSPFRFRLIPCEATGEPVCRPCGCSTGGRAGGGLALSVIAAAVGRRRGAPQHPAVTSPSRPKQPA